MVSISAPLMAVEGVWGAEERSKEGFNVEDIEEEGLGVGDAVDWKHMTEEIFGKDEDGIGKKEEEEGLGREMLGSFRDGIQDEE